MLNFLYVCTSSNKHILGLIIQIAPHNSLNACINVNVGDKIILILA